MSAYDKPGFEYSASAEQLDGLAAELAQWSDWSSYTLRAAVGMARSGLGLERRLAQRLAALFEKRRATAQDLVDRLRNSGTFGAACQAAALANLLEGDRDRFEAEANS